jgi:hypothetical protein
MNKFHSEKTQILGTAVGGMFARDTCNEDFVRYTSVLRHASWMLLDFSVVTGRGTKIVNLMLVRSFACLPRHDMWIYYCYIYIYILLTTFILRLSLRGWDGMMCKYVPQ